MILSILIAGVAIGSIYAMIGICYNIMYSTSKVLSFTSGQLGMIGAVFGAWFIGDLQWPIWLGFPAAMLVGIAFGFITELIAVRPVLKNIEQHFYVLSTLAFALMVQTAAAIWWGTEPRPFPTLIGLGAGALAEKYWLPVVVCLLTMVTIDLFYRKTLWGRAFTAISEDPGAALALGIPERRMRVISYGLAGFVGALARANFLAVEDQVALLESNLAECESSITQPARKRVIASGILPPPPAITDLIEQAGLRVAGNDIASMHRSYAYTPEEWDDAGDYYVRFYRDHFPCTTLLHTADRRLDAALEMVAGRDARAFLFVGEKFCEYEYFELPILAERLKEAGVQSLAIEVSIDDDGSAENFRTRIDAFAEMLSQREGHDGA